MSAYTRTLELDAAELPEHDAFDKLPAIIASFRGQGAALREFLCAHGFIGALDDIVGQEIYLKDRFAAAGIERSKARNAGEWLRDKPFDRVTGFRIAFALGLSVAETNEFFRTVLLERGFDCHKIREAVYYFSVNSGRGYPEAERIIALAPKPTESAIPFDGDVLYTRNIEAFIRDCKSEATLLRYFEENIAQFSYNHAKSSEFIKGLWEKIAGENGLAAQERKYFQFAESQNSSDVDSSWQVYLQILGLDQDAVKNIELDRTIRPILENQTFIHEFAAKNFPGRQEIEKILRGKKAENDVVRKILIILVFYHFWLSTALAKKGPKTYEAGINDRERCLAELNQYLLDASFPELYPGNPYDWIFIWAAGREAPLMAFRFYWNILSAEHQDRLRLEGKGV